MADSVVRVQVEGLEKVKRALAEYREVVTFYLEVAQWTEPLGMDGCCHFCYAPRVGDGVIPHLDTCAWWKVAKPLFDAETERR